MDIEIVSRDFPATEPIKEHVSYKLAGVLAWDSREIEHVRVTLGHANGPRGGAEKYCRVIVQLVGSRVIQIEHRSRALYDAISRCCAHVDRAVAEAHARRRRNRRRRSLGMMWG